MVSPPLIEVSKPLIAPGEIIFINISFCLDNFVCSQAALSNDKKSSKMEEDENDDDEDYSEYSEDFETSQLNTSSGSHRRGVPSPKKPTRNVSQSWKSLPKLSEEPILPVQDHQKIIEDQILELLRRESRAAYKPPPPELSTGDPITDSVAKSFLASQVCLFMAIHSFCC